MGNTRAEDQRSEIKQGERRKILVVGKDDLFTDAIMDYAVHLAERLGYDILAMSVGTAWSEKYPSTIPGPSREAFKHRAMQAADAFRQKAAQCGVRCEHVVKFGELGESVEQLNHEVKRIDFVVTESEASKEEVAKEVTIPVFAVISNSWTLQGGDTMANDYAAQKNRPVGKMVGYGLLSAALYAAVFLNADTVMHYFTRGGLYAALPIATVFVFSFAHGAFASNLWSVLGIEALKKDSLRQTEQKVVQQRKRPQKRARLQAYINPFHKM